jgi:multiple sugar transport system substrate-binding protein
MTREIEFSSMGPSAEPIQPLLDQFEAENDIHVRLRPMTWDVAWGDLVRVALYGDGPDVSEIGSTWLGDLVAMNALHPFQPSDIQALGGASAFLPSAWQGTHVVGQPQTWAIPWVTGARLVLYRRSLLEAAGIDPRTAFYNAAQFDDTLQRLQASGLAVPFTMPTGVTHTSLLNAASWVWGAGGDFMAAEGRHTLFTQPAARAGLRAYFALGRYLAPEVRRLTGLEPDQYFVNNPNVAVTLSGAWTFDLASSALRADLGVALPAGVSFVGGSHLVVWKHTPHAEAANRLIRFLTQTKAQVQLSQQLGLLPATLDGLGSPPYATEPHWRVAVEGLKTGRSFPVTRSWGLMEDRLTTVLATIWADLLANPDLDLDTAIGRRLDPLARRLDLVLGQS